MDSNDWRAQFAANSRQKILEKIKEVLAKTIPHNGEEGLRNVERIAVQFEGKIYNAAPSQSDYIGAISRKMLTMESMSQNSDPNSGKILKSEIQDQPRTGPRVESSRSQLISSGVSNANRNPVQNFGEQEGITSSNFANSQRRLQQNPGALVYQDQLMKEKLHSPEIQNKGFPQMQLLRQGVHSPQMGRPSHMELQKQAVKEPSLVQSAPTSGLHQHQQLCSVLPQTILREQQQWAVLQENQRMLSESIVREKQQQQQTIIQHNQASSKQHPQPQQQSMIGQQPIAMNIQTNRPIAQETSIPDVLPHQERPMSQHGAHVSESRAVSGGSRTVVEDPLGRLIKAMLSIPHKNLVPAVGDIFSVDDMLPETAPRAIARKNLFEMVKPHRRGWTEITPAVMTRTKRMRYSMDCK